MAESRRASSRVKRKPVNYGDEGDEVAVVAKKPRKNAKKATIADVPVVADDEIKTTSTTPMVIDSTPTTATTTAATTTATTATTTQPQPTTTTTTTTPTTTAVVTDSSMGVVVEPVKGKGKAAKTPKVPKAPKAPKVPKEKKPPKEKVPKEKKPPKEKKTKKSAEQTPVVTTTTATTPGTTTTTTTTATPTVAATAVAPVKEKKPRKSAKATASAASSSAVPEIPIDPTEVRVAGYVGTCSSGIKTRISRAVNERLYLLSTTPGSDCRCYHKSPHHKEFAVLGSTGNVYTVTICKKSTCSCPDFGNGNLCKHILFVFLKVLGVERKSPLLYQKALLNGELANIFARAPVTKAALADKKVIAAYKKVTGSLDEADVDKEEDKEEDGAVKQKPVGEDVCAICYDEISATDNVVWCRVSCGNNLHKDCFQRWSVAQKTRGGTISCVYCRADWPVETPKATGATGYAPGVTYNEGYTNLANLSGQSSHRDWSGNWYDYRYGGYSRYRGYW